MTKDYKDFSYEELKAYDKELGMLIASKENPSFVFLLILYASFIVLLFFAFRLVDAILNTFSLIECSIFGVALFCVIKSIYMGKEVEKLKKEYCSVYIELGLKSEKMRRAIARKEFNKIVAKVERDKSKRTKQVKS
jgi:hypothetical protein